MRLLLLTLALVLGLPVAASAADSDGDGLRDGFERRYGVTDPQLRDSDGDGVIDSAEDDDGDRLSNLGEQRFGTHPGKRDTDGDGIPDGREDADGNGRSNARQQDQRPLPAGLRPSLARAMGDTAKERANCRTHERSSRILPCEFGDTGSDTTVVLMGDSHAVVWLPPMITIARSQGWRLVTLLKGACPPVLGTLSVRQFELDGGKSCRRWRQAAYDWLQEHPAELLVLVHSDRYGLVGPKGRMAGTRARLDQWRGGLKRTLAGLPDATRALVLGDVPRNRENPIPCLRRSKRDMSACASPRLALRDRPVEMALRSAAKASGAVFRTLYPRICSYDPCPLVQGNVLIYRDEGHLTVTFTKRLRPSLRAHLLAALASD